MKFLVLLFRVTVAGAFSVGARCEDAGGDKISFPSGSIECGADGSPLLYAFENGLGFGTLPEEAKILSETGYGGVSQVSGDPVKLPEMVAAYRKEGLRVRSVYLDAGGEALDAETLEVLARSGAMIELTVKTIDPGTVDVIRKTCVAAERFGMKVALYPHHGYAVATMPQAMDLIAEVDHPNLGVMFNLCHFLRGEDVADLEKVIKGAGDRLFAVSVFGADPEGEGWPDLIKPLDEGAFPQKRLLEALADAGFEGPVSLQCYGVPGDKRKNLERSMVAWKKLTG